MEQARLAILLLKVDIRLMSSDFPQVTRHPSDGLDSVQGLISKLCMSKIHREDTRATPGCPAETLHDLCSTFVPCHSG